MTVNSDDEAVLACSSINNKGYSERLALTDTELVDLMNSKKTVSAEGVRVPRVRVRMWSALPLVLPTHRYLSCSVGPALSVALSVAPLLDLCISPSLFRSTRSS